MKKFLKSFFWALNGFKTAWLEEQNFKIEIIIGTIAILGSIFLSFPVTKISLIIMCAVVVIGAELVNTAIEDLCNKVEPKTDEAIRKIKDLMAGFVLTLSFGSLLIGLLIFASELWF